MGKFELEMGGRKIEIDINNLAEQASGSVFVRYGDTLILVTCVISKEERGNLDFFPLTVEYEERYYAAGKILGSRYLRRESRPSDGAITTARLIDRAIRPLFPKNLKREVQVIITCLSWDKENDPDIFGLIGASLALGISEIPWLGPIAVLRVGKIDEKFILNPTYEEREKSSLDLVVAGTKKNKEILVNMIEAESQELSEEEILRAVDFAKSHLEKLIEFQKQIIEKNQKAKLPLETLPDLELEKEVKNFLKGKLEEALYQKEKSERAEALQKLKEELTLFIEEKYPGGRKTQHAFFFFEEEISRILQEKIIKFGERPDGRKTDQIREISCQVGILPRTHGSGLFCRGQTKSLSILTLGAPGDVRLMEGMEIVGKKRFMHHYNFPPYSVGEIKPIRGPGRREIGHGILAEKALFPIIPSCEEFPYTIRIVSEILSSNGSTSMASTSSSSLALMDAGVPIKRPVAGIALGLVMDEKGNYKILTDIQGPEDHYGEMDFKVAGSEKGITAVQMDVKIDGINEKILKEALCQAKKARVEILEKMAKVLSCPRPELSLFAPRILTLRINPEKIREVIGPGGKVINAIIEECGVSIDVEDSGKIFVTAEKEEAAKKAVAWIKNITHEVGVGEVFQGKVKRILNFGAIVEILPGQEGLIHLSQLAPWGVKKIESIMKVGDIVPVEVISIDEYDRINLSLKKERG